MANVHPSAVIAENVELAENVVIGPNCVVGKGSSIGSGSTLLANVIVGRDVTIGENNQMSPNAVVGGQPQILGLGPDGEYGKLTIGNNNIIRENVTIHPSMHPDKTTKIGNSNLLMVGVHIGHDCELEDDIVFSNYTQISGHCHIQQGVWFSGMVLVHQFITIGKWCYAAGMAGINHDVPPFVIVSGHYPPTIRGINKRGLSRAGLNEKQQKEIMAAYKKLYRNGKNLIKNAQQMKDEGNNPENVKAMIDIIINGSKHRYGRHLELFR